MELGFIHLTEVSVEQTQPQSVRAQNSPWLAAMLQDQTRAVVFFHPGKKEEE